MKIVLAVGCVIIALVLLAGFWAYSLITGSLPDLEGEVQIAGLSGPVIIERDRLGIPTIRGQNQADVARVDTRFHLIIVLAMRIG